jgi:hypothetical protein
MTLILATPEAIYADTTLADSDIIVGHIDKLVRVSALGGMWIGTCGDAAVARAHREALRRSDDPLDLVTPSNVSALAVASGGRIFFADADGVLSPVKAASFMAIGLPWQIATGAMDAGLSVSDVFAVCKRRWPNLSDTVHIGRPHQTVVEAFPYEQLPAF